MSWNEKRAADDAYGPPGVRVSVAGGKWRWQWALRRGTQLAEAVWVRVELACRRSQALSEESARTDI